MNEAQNLPWVLDRLPTGVHEVILVDGHSTDDTVAVAKRLRPDIRVVTQVARGKGAALATGFLAATGDIVVMIDADGSMDPVEISAFVGALLAGADLAKGSRYVAGGGSHDLCRLRGLGNRGLALVANLLYGQSWSELCYGYAAFWADVLPKVDVTSLVVETAPAAPRWARFGSGRPQYGHGFEIEALLFCRAVTGGARVVEVASFEHPRRFGTSNLATFRDGTRVLMTLLHERRRLDRRRRSRLGATAQATPVAAQ